MSKTETPVMRPRTEEGYPLPTIREWNDGAIQAEEEMTEITESDPRTPVYRGAVDDLEKGTCGYCNDEMIRSLRWTNGPFNAGVVYCQGTQTDTKHPLEFWFEMWPYADTKRHVLMGMNSITPEESNKKAFRLSNPIVTDCYTATAINWHQHFGIEEDADSIGLAYSPGGRTTSLPKPNYTHK